MSKELDLITAVDIIEAVEKSPYYGDYEFLKKALGCETFKKMLKLGYIHGGLSLSDTNINRTYGVSQRYADTRDSIKRERRWYNTGVQAIMGKIIP
jgi:hypothetical protein